MLRKTWTSQNTELKAHKFISKLKNQRAEKNPVGQVVHLKQEIATLSSEHNAKICQF